MWYDRFTFIDKQPGLSTVLPENYFTNPFTEAELALFPVDSLYPNAQLPGTLPIPPPLKLPDEYIELLHYSNGGQIIQGDIDFGFFSPDTIREFYISYGFAVSAPAFLPIALDGGGNFYVYDTRQPANFPILLMSAATIGYGADCWIFLGDTLASVLSRLSTNDEEIHSLTKQSEPTETQKTTTDIKLKLKQLTEDRKNGLIDLKSYLLAKRKLDNDLKRASAM